MHFILYGAWPLLSSDIEEKYVPIVKVNNTVFTDILNNANQNIIEPINHLNQDIHVDQSFSNELLPSTNLQIQSPSKITK